MFSKFFISKPVLSTVIAIIIMILGFSAIKSLPISQFPNLTPPTVVVSASYPGADAETIANNILTPLEAQISGADGLMYMTGKASALSGTASITCTFNIGVNQDLAAVDIQNRINSVLAQLPQTTRDLGVTVEKRTSDILLIVSVTSPDGSMSDTEISNYILIVGAFIIGAIFTPPDIMSQVLLAVPLWLLYELGMVLAQFIKPVKKPEVDQVA